VVEDVLKWWPVALFVFQGLGIWIAWSLSKKYVTREDCKKCRDERDKANGKEAEAMSRADKEKAEACKECREAFDKRLDKVEKRGATVDVILETLPKVKDIHDLSISLESLRGGQQALTEGVKSLGVSMDALRRNIDMLMENELNGGGK